MRSISTENYAALQARKLVARDFIWFIVRDRESGADVTDGYWSDVGVINAEVIDPNTGGSVERQWYGSGTLIQISDIPLVSNLTVQTIAIRLSQVADRVNQLVRDYDCKQGQVQIFRGLFDPNSRVMVAPAEPRFVGFIDTVEILTPAENEDGGVTINCVSHTQEMTRSNPDTRSHESQILRHANDNFYQDTTVVGEWSLFWGRANGTLSASAAPSLPPDLIYKAVTGLFKK